MVRGFTLIELIITLAITVSLLFFAAPSFDALLNKVKMQRLAGALNGFLMQAKSEAITRNKKLYLHFSFAHSTRITGGVWHLTLTDSSTSTGQLLLHLDGAAYANISIQHSYHSAYISFDGVRGRPNGGHIAFNPHNDPSGALRVIIANPPGRVKVCSGSEDRYGYPVCS